MDKRILLNFDVDYEYFFVKSLGGNYGDIAQKAIAYFDRIYRDKGIGDILFNVFCQSSLTPSRVFTTRAEKYHVKQENGIAVDYTEQEYLAASKLLQEDLGINLTALWMQRCREVGIHPWLSVRMNDHHCQYEQTNFLRSDFFYEAQKNGWLLGKKYRSSFNDYDYGVPEVRAQMLAYIKEQLTAFDVFGLELDYMREPKCVRFYDDPHACDVMTAFMEQVKEVVRACEALHGHRIQIAVRMPRDIETCRLIGFDVAEWARRGLVDAVSPTSHWPGVDTDMPIAAWCKALDPYGVDVWAGMEMNLPHKLYVDTEVAKAFTAQYHAQGSKRTYIYNLYHPALEYINELDMWAIPAPTEQQLLQTWGTCGDVAKCARGVRRHIVTEESPAFNDLKPTWRPLPRALGEGFAITLQTGEIAAEAQVTLYVGVKPAAHVTVCVNGVPCARDFGNTGAHILQNKEIDPQTVAAFAVPRSACRGTAQEAFIAGDADAELFYVELMIDAK